MNLTLPTFEQIEARVLARLQGTVLADLGPGSIVRMLVRTLIAELTDPQTLWDGIKDGGKAAHLGTAEDTDLDGVGTFYGDRGKRRVNESNAEYRYRLAQIVAAEEPGSLEAIRYAAQAIPGVAAIVARPYVYGPGSFALALLGTADINSVETAIRPWISPGSYYRVYTAREVAVKLKINLRFTAKATQTERQSAQIAAEQAVRRHVLTLGLGAGVVLDLVRRTAIESHPTIIECHITSIETNGVPALVQDILVPWDSVATLTSGSAVEVSIDAYGTLASA